ncbi:MAG: TetR/AcrR family transcriptional regulator [Candidatus Aminicenantes bacterium]|nr:TetR/AcrR family transcriptional regulator [Candidatus Aminicenantes bacterium]
MNSLTGRQKEIIEASIDIISKKGIQNLTIKNLSKKIGFSEPAIYRHFESKVGILLTILSRFESQIRKSKILVNSEANSALKQLDLIFKNQFNNFSKNPALASVVFAEEIFQDDRRLSEKIYSIMDFNFELILSIIKSGQRNGEIRPDIEAEQLVLIIMGSLRLIIKKWKKSEYSFNLRKDGEKLWKSINTMISI